jgi:maleylacetate reductase
MTPSIIEQSPSERFITGTPAAEAVAAEAERRGAARVFILSGATLESSTDEIRKIEERLGTRHARTYAGISSHAPLSEIVDGIVQARDAQADLIVTVGGGSITDSGKVVAIGLKAGVKSMSEIPEFVETYKWGKRQASPETAPDVKLICVPTTLSGGELNFVAGAYHPELGKIGFEHLANAPATIVYDPWITLHTPMWLWLSTGVRSIDHAVETLASPGSSEYFDAIAETALRLLADGLRRTARDSSDIEGRMRCQIGAWQSMVGLLNGVPMGASHAIGQSLGGVAQVPHGYTSCVLLPAVLEWNEQAASDRLSRVSAALGDAAVPAHRLLDQLIRSLGQPRTLAAVGVEDKDGLFDRIAEHAAAHAWIKTNPRPIEGKQSIIDILALAAL